MARPLRIERAGGWYHITARGNERRAIFRSDQDREHFLELLPRLKERFRCELYAYALMENHYHLFLETYEANLSRALQWLNVSYTVWFNRRHQRCGHLFQGRFKAVLVDPLTWALALSRYIHLNPVRMRRLGSDKAARVAARRGAGSAPSVQLVQQRLEELRRFRWSSYRAYTGQQKTPEWLNSDRVLGLGGGPRAEWKRNYREYCEQAVREGNQECPWADLEGGVILGSEEFIDEIKEEHGSGAGGKALREALAARPSWQEVVRAVERVKKEKWASFCERRGDWGRDLALHLGRELAGLKLQELAEQAGSGGPMSVSMALRRFMERLDTDSHLAHALQQTKSKLAFSV